MSVKISRYNYIKVDYEAGEPEAVARAAGNLVRDLRRVLDCCPEPPGNVPFHRITVGTLGVSEEICRKAEIGLLADEEGLPYKEAFLIQEKDGELLIAGSDRRGTVYGIYEFCERYLGVSPWYFFGDVPVRRKQEIFFPDGFTRTDRPSVEYRGIFINDEEELEHWVQRYMGEDTIGVKTYEKIFELLLRLKMNYIWPAMHVNSFNLKKENGALADAMGIVVGTSHCDMLMRSNNREWKPWLKKKGYEDAVYDFSIPGRNREILKEYWQESVEQNRDFEVSYTLGMRGIHDSGFETKTLEGKTGKELLEAKLTLLDSVIKAQQEILADTLSHETLKTFVPYKEVLELYDNGLKVPEDLTLIWVNDNYGYVRRYPGEEEKKRRGGNGIYYHNSYWAPPGGSYLFLCSIPLAHTRNELLKAYEEGIRKIWVTNFGAIKPLEQQISFYAALAWEAGKKDALTDNEELFLEKWIDDTFSGGFGKELAPCLLSFDQLTNTRKVEQMDMDAFSQTAYGDEAAGRIHRYEEMFQKVNRIWKSLPRQEQDAFFQMIAMKFHAAYFTNLMYYYADRSVLCMEQGKEAAAAKYTRQGKLLDRARRSMLSYYNHVMSNGKWNGILTPEDFPPPRTAMHPAFMPPIGAKGDASAGEWDGKDPAEENRFLASAVSAARTEAGEGAGSAKAEDTGRAAGPVISLWNEGSEIVFTRPVVKWLEIGNNSKKPCSCRISGPDWIRFTDSGLSEVEAAVKEEERILFEADWEKLRRCSEKEDGKSGCAECKPDVQRIAGEIRITDDGGEVICRIPVSALPGREPAETGAGESSRNGEPAETVADRSRENAFPVEYVADRSHGNVNFAATEDDGRICVEAQNAEAFPAGDLLAAGWKRIENLGRDSSALLESRREGAVLSYPVQVFSAGRFLLEMHRFPSLNSVGEICAGVSVDNGQMQILRTESKDEYCGTWKENVRNNVDKLYLELPYMEAGRHVIRIHGISRYFAFTRFVIYTDKRKENSLGKEGGNQHLPLSFDSQAFVREFYGEEAGGLLPRPVHYLPLAPEGDSLTMEDIVIQPTVWERTILAEKIVESGRSLFTEAAGAVRIEAAAALAQSTFACTEKGNWKWCNSPSHGESGLAMYLREENKSREADENAPALRYRIRVTGGDYRIWVRVLMWGEDTSHFTLAIDGKMIPERELYGGHAIWRYSNEQVWKWIPVYKVCLPEGEHLIKVISLCSRLRFEQIYLTKGSELPGEI